MMGARIRRLEGETVKRAVVGLVFLVALWGAALAQEYVGAWAVTEKVDAFTDERQVTLVIGENGEYAEANSNAVLAFVCAEDTINTIQVQFRNPVDVVGDVEIYDFEYRLDSGPVLTGQASVNGRVVAVTAENNPETFQALSEAFLSGTEKYRMRIKPVADNEFTAVFVLDRLQDAVNQSGCTMQTIQEPSDGFSDDGNAEDAGGASGDGGSSSP